ncbi:uncharacterized protein B0I36DRAFT_97201 [Microdochium trichocladiopsis]|uniref:DUF6594 domain-containing protein n=1 Tax=Microdochium trichocladiopsis TaxID=1682393 RepID=A0A9P8YF35_9PEZI|nr:uncharacterized protein B0I36DRAFT_97201 [Microdochium trichocladiopsis]KAH7035832.1 hypothetical protein B0I36DRAFT_97201 [Microdochium trichocladiopsis]
MPQHNVSHSLDAMSPIARLMDRQEELTILRRFDELHLLNLLIMQNEIDCLLKELEKYEPGVENEASSTITPMWYSLPRPAVSYSQAATDQRSKEALDDARSTLWATIRVKLREYDSAVLDFARLRGLEEPSGQDVRQLRAELGILSAREGAHSRAAQSWDSEHDDDFVTLRITRDKGSRLINSIKLAWGLWVWEYAGERKAPTIPTEPGGPREIVVGKQKPSMSRAEMAQKHARASRFIMAFFGGVALIVPTVIMSKVEGINTSLIVTSVSVLIFGFLAAQFGNDSTGKDVLAATAAYTAVLVVFVGTSLASNGEAPTAPAEAS